LVAVCALNRWTAGEITAEYRLTKAEVVKDLLVKDRMGVIELPPSDRIRSLVARDFDWLPDGPIRAYFMDHALGDFVGSRFSEGHETMNSPQGSSLTGAHTARQGLRRLRARRPQCTRSQRQRLSSSGRGIGLMLALRRWEPENFNRLRRSASVQSRLTSDRKVRFKAE